jgi:hypothetical protein
MSFNENNYSVNYLIWDQEPKVVVVDGFFSCEDDDKKL